MYKVKLSVGIIDLKINNIFSVYRACLEAGFKTEIIELKKASYNYSYASRIIIVGRIAWYFIIHTQVVVGIARI